MFGSRLKKALEEIDNLREEVYKLKSKINILSASARKYYEDEYTKLKLSNIKKAKEEILKEEPESHNNFLDWAHLFWRHLRLSKYRPVYPYSPTQCKDSYTALFDDFVFDEETAKNLYEFYIVTQDVEKKGKDNDKKEKIEEEENN